jgi:hypothetical protein
LMCLDDGVTCFALGLGNYQHGISELLRSNGQPDALLSDWGITSVEVVSCYGQMISPMLKSRIVRMSQCRSFRYSILFVIQ